ncbi:MAG TPA: hypothetical protein VF411_10070, partial [Bacteroidia bacterium]
MKTIKYAFCFLIVSVFVLQSCSVEKRRYTSGYSLQWNNPAVGGANTLAQNTKISLPEGKKILETPAPSKENIISESSLNVLTASSDKKKGVILLTVDSIGCDTLIMRDGTEIKVKVTEVTPTEIKYKFCNNIDGPSYVIYRYQASYIKYRNGTLDSFVSEHPPIAPPANRNNGNYNQNNSGAFNGNDSHHSMD